MLFSDINPNEIYSYFDYYLWDFEQRVELIDGKVFEMSPAPNRKHQEILGKLYIKIGNFLSGSKCKAYIAPFDVRFPKAGMDDKTIFTVLQPDLCVVCDKTKLDDRGCIGAPELVMEVLSPGNNTRDLKKKYNIYESAGVLEYWIISPQNEWLQIHTLRNNTFAASPLYLSGDVVTSTVIDGFKLNVSDLFEEDDDVN